MENYKILETFDPDEVLAAAKESLDWCDSPTYPLRDDCGFGHVVEEDFWIPYVHRIETGYLAQVASGTGWMHAAGTHATLNEAARAAHEKAAEVQERYENTESEFEEDDDDEGSV